MSYRSDRLHIDHSDGVLELETVHRTLSGEDIRKITRFYEELVKRDFSLRDLLELQALMLRNQAELQRGFHDVLSSLKPKTREQDKMFG